jgi:uncharacterized cupredoxin-like copper-binding protein
MKNTHKQNLLIAALLATASFNAAAQNMQAMPAMSHHHAEHAEHAGDTIGQPGAAGKVTRTVKVDMSDNMRFTPEKLQVKTGDTIRFVVSNSGKIRHELVFGNEAQLKAHYAAMLKNPEMEHADDNQITLEPGKSGELIWQFTQTGTVNFACLQPGHYDAGMKGSVTVASGDSTHKH